MHRHRRRGVLLLTLLTATLGVWSAPAHGQETAPLAWLDDPALARLRLAELVERIDARRQEQHVPGAAFALVRDGQTLVLTGLGLRDLERKLPVTPDTLFAIGSHTKSFTAVLNAMLVDQGALSWDDPVRRHIPNFHLSDPEADEKATLRDLASHRTGLTRMPLLWAKGEIPLEQLLPSIAKAKPYAPFRKAFLYNNVTYALTGLAASKAAGAPWEELIRSRILEPLGMVRSNTSAAEAQRDPQLAVGYQWEESLGAHQRLPMRRITTVAPAGAINATAAELTRWLRFLLARGAWKGEQLLSPQRLEELWTPQIPIGPGLSYGLGWMVQEIDGRRVVHHGGNIDGYAAMVGLFPDDGVGFALLMNVTAAPLQNEVIDILAEELFGDGSEVAEAAVQTHKPEDLTPYLGRYYLEALSREVTVLEREGRLALDVPGQTVYTLKWPDEDGRWVFELTDQIAVTFTLGEDGRMASLTVHQAGRAMPAKRVDEDAGFTVEQLQAKLDERGAPPSRFRLRGTIRNEHQGVEGTAELLIDGERFRFVQDFGPFGTVLTVFDGRRGWQKTPGAPPRELFGEQLEQLVLGSPAAAAMPLEKLYASVEPLRTEEREGRKLWVARLVPPTAPAVTAFIDAATGRTVRTESSVVIPGAGGLPAVSQFGDFQPVGEGELPMRSVTEIAAVGVTVVRFTEVEIDPLVQEDDFAPLTERAQQLEQRR